jgi:subtilisin family serine protease
MKPRKFFSLLIYLLLTGRAFAGTISPYLEHTISGLGSSEKVPVVILMKKSKSTSPLKTTLYREYRTRAQRHGFGILKLKKDAEVQNDLLGKLNKMEEECLAADIKGHWIINAVTADIAVSELDELALRDDVARIFPQPTITLVGPDDDPAPFSDAAALIEPNLKTIGADSAWALGYTGAGRIVCSFDTGVKGIHPALYDRWKGLDGNSSAAWYDPIGRESFPHDESSDHGTHVMGIMVGLDSSNLDEIRYIGVAPGAKWISAAVIDIWGASIIDAFEWAADPDGDPNTISDVPDVINHSWGLFNSTAGCNDYFYEVINNTEALGIVNIFAAGNEGEAGSMTIRNPANRAYDSLDCFAVGMIDYRDSLLDERSSRGPSDCDQLIIKPNVVAPGVFIRSSAGSSSYIWRDGTSMAAPHVSGAVAILREYAPDATAEEIKEALLAGCRRLPAGDSLPNNDYGWGLIYIPAALEALSPSHRPDLRIYSYDHVPVNPGDTASGYIAIKNSGSEVDSVYSKVLTSDGALTVLTDSLFFGYLGPDDISFSNIPFEAAVHDTVPDGAVLTIDLGFYGRGGYISSDRLFIEAGKRPPVSFYTHKNNVLRFTVSNFGQYGFADWSFNPLGYSGFRYVDTLRNDLMEGALLVGVGPDHVSDGARNIAKEPDNDFAVAAASTISDPGAFADQETHSTFDDKRAEHPIGIRITQNTYCWKSPPNDNFVILEYIIQNIADTAVTGMYVGLFFDWNLHTAKNDGGGSRLPENLGYLYHDSTIFPYIPSRYRGIAVLNSEGIATHKIRRRPTEWANPLSDDTTYVFPENEKYLALSEGILDSDDQFVYDLSQTVSTGPFTLLPKAIDTAVFAVVAADTSLTNLITAASRAKDKYDHLTDVEDEGSDLIPNIFSLNQNYPNPFNSTTIISFTLKVRADVRLTIYNILGNRVIDLVDCNLAAGYYRFRWDGRDYSGVQVASGPYLYQLHSGNFRSARRMILVK